MDRIDYQKKRRKNVKIIGTNIEERPDCVGEKIEFGHLEGDAVVGERKGCHGVILECQPFSVQFFLELSTCIITRRDIP